MVEYWRIKSDNWRLNGLPAVRCLFAPETSLHVAGQNGNSRIKMKFQAWRSVTTDHTAHGVL